MVVYMGDYAFLDNMGCNFLKMDLTLFVVYAVLINDPDIDELNYIYFTQRTFLICAKQSFGSFLLLAGRLSLMKANSIENIKRTIRIGYQVHFAMLKQEACRFKNSVEDVVIFNPGNQGFDS